MEPETVRCCPALTECSKCRRIVRKQDCYDTDRGLECKDHHTLPPPRRNWTTPIECKGHNGEHE